jgi:hypothetical protein
MAKINALKLKSAITKYGEQIKSEPENAEYLLTENGYTEDEAFQIIDKVNESDAPVKSVKKDAPKSLQPMYERWTVETVKTTDRDGNTIWKLDENGNYTYEKVKLIRLCSGEPNMIDILNDQAFNTHEYYYEVK